MTWRHGVRVTTPARTAADLLRCAPASEAVALVDAALRRGDLSYAQLAEVLDWQERWPHVRRGRSLLTLIDPRRETWIESWSFAELYEVGVPLPEPQVDVFDAHGLWIARADGLWVAEATVAEADGQIKYALDSPLNGYNGMLTQEQVRRVQRRLDEQRRREDLLRDTGLQMVRYGVRDVTNDLAGLATRINERRAQGDLGRFTGSFRFQPALPWRS
jgi:hypothetical protein